MNKMAALFSALLLFGVFEASAGNYVVGVEALKYYPLYEGKGANYKGYARDLIDEFGKASGHTFTYKAVPVKRLFNEYLAGNMDFKYPDNAKWASGMKKAHDISYSDSTVEYIDGIMALPSNSALNVENFKNIGTLRGFTPWIYMDDISKGSMKLSESNDLKALILMTESGRVQGAYFNLVVANYYMKNTLKKPGLLTFNKSLPHTKDYFSLSSFKHPKIIAEFNAFLKNKKSVVDKLKDKYQVRLP